ncbi:MAG: RluA family pseudouridine synthase [Lachnospiraceae bacterium]|nr:RluA family pseudouridine synthase [Lachnospiraceae bacterium]
MAEELRQEFEVTKEFDGERIDRYLTQIYTDQSRSFFQKLIRSGNVTIQGNPVTKTGTTVDVGDLVSVLLPEPQSVDIKPQDIPLDILYEDDDLLVVNKPKGMVVHPSPGHYEDTLVNAVLFHCKESLSGINGQSRPGIVHRIDKDTTGSLIVCKNDRAHMAIARQIQEHTVKRLYRGIVCGVLKEDEAVIDAPIGRNPSQRQKMAVNTSNGKPAVTHYRVLERYARYTYAEFRLETGRTHQIRVHMESIHHPLLGDELYGGMTKDYAIKGLEGQTLHAMTIGFVHPTTEEYMEFTAPLPEYFEDLLKRFRE